MNLNKVPAEFVDDLFGDPESRRNLERAASPVKDIDFELPDDVTGDCSAVLAEVEEAELQELFCGFTSTAPAAVKTPSAVVVNLKGRRISLPRGLRTSFDCGYVGVLPEKFYRSDTTQAVRSYLTACLDDRVPAAKLSALRALAEAS